MKFHLPTTLMASVLAIATAVTLSSCGDKEAAPAKDAPAATPDAAPAPAAPAAKPALELGAVKSWDDAKARIESDKRYKRDMADILKAIEAVQGGADINKTAVGKQDNLLSIACGKNDYDMAAFLISQGADVATGADVKSPKVPFLRAFIVADKDDYKLAEALITSGLVQPNQIGDDETPLLCHAADNRVLPLAKLLVERGADIEAVDKYGKTAIFYALSVSGITFGPSSDSIAQYLLDKGAKVDVVTKSGMTLLMACAPWLSLEQVEALVAKGADLKAVDNDGKGYAIHLCNSGNKVRALEILKALGDRVDVVTPDKSGWNTIFVVANYMKPKEATPLIEYLIERGADPKATWKATGATCLHNSVTSFKDKTPEIAEVLIKAGADVNAQTVNGLNPAMHCMSLSGSTMNLDFLLKNGTDVNAKDKKGRGLWDYAEKHSKKDYDYKKVLEDNNVPKP